MDSNVKITTEYIKLDQLLKFAGAVIINGKVSVNGEICLMRGKKIRSGDIVTINGKNIAVE